MISLVQLVCVLLSLAAVGLATDSPVKRAVSGNQLECTRIFVESLVGNDEEACVIAALQITRALSESDIVSELDTISSPDFAEFCRPSCGRRVLTAWKTCGVSQNYEQQIDLVTSLCGTGKDMDCHENVTGLFEFIDEVVVCSNEPPEGVCSERCNDLINDALLQFSCCVNVPIDYRVANGENDLRSVVESTVDTCSERLKDPCTPLIVEPEFLSDVIDIEETLSPDQIVCINDLFNLRSGTISSQCRAAANTLTTQINSKSLLTSLTEDSSALAEFCTPSCGPQIVSTWMTCRAYDDIRGEADFLSRLCDIYQGQPCYAVFNTLQLSTDDSTYCGTRSDGTSCPVGCSTVYSDLVQDFGCCIDIFVDYLDASITQEPGQPTILERNQELFSSCNAQLPAQCTESALTQTVTTTQPPQSTTNPTSCPTSSGAGSAVATLAVVILAILCLGLF